MGAMNSPTKVDSPILLRYIFYIIGAGNWSGELELLLAILFLVVIYLVVAHARLRKRVTRVEARLIFELASHDEASKTKAKPAIADDPAKKPKAAVSQKVQATTKPGNPWQKAAQSSAVENSQTLQRSGIVAPTAAAPTKTRYVFNSDNFAAALIWAKSNWFYLVAAASLGLAGVFLVQYGVENGILPPKMRVLAALALGLILIGAGEYLRRRGGDKAGDLFAYLPSTFAAGGLLSLFAGTLSARVLYGLISAETALFGLGLVGVLAVFIGWFYGPLLAAIGILGATLAPFLVGGEPGAAQLLYYYFSVIAVVAMAVDTFKRWAWLSGFGVMLTYVAAANIFVLAGEGVHFLAFGVIVTLASAVIPERRLIPQHAGKMVLEELRQIARPKSETTTGFPTRLIAGVFTATVLSTIWVYLAESNSFWLAIIVLIFLFTAAAIWMRHAPALGDLVVLPTFGLPLLIWFEATERGDVFQGWIGSIGRVAEDPAPWTLMILWVMALGVTLIGAWRSYFDAPYRNYWALGAAAFTPIVVVLLELFWQPSEVIGADIWAYQVIGLAGVMVVLAQRFAQRYATDHAAAAYFTLAAMTLISLALILILTSAALTLALAVMVLAATLLDRRFNLPALSVFVIIGAGTIGWRLVIDPGVFWAWDAPLWEVAATYTATLLLLWASRILLLTSPRKRTFGVVDGAFWSLSGVFATILISRGIDHYFPGKDDSHAIVSLIAMVWLISAANQLWRLKYNELPRWVRVTWAILYAIPGFAALAAVVTFLNPLFNSWEPVFGPYLFDSLLVAYAIPALFFLSLTTWFKHLPNWLRTIFAGLGISMATLYVGLEIRRIWRGDNLSVAGTTDPELYTYTVVMLLAATALLFYSFYRHNTLLRKIALAGIGLTVAKVFLIDVSGLTGLTRVFSFLVLGLSLAGLAWLDRWFGAKTQQIEEAD
jgi:uncharacterized membrane protein